MGNPFTGATMFSGGGLLEVGLADCVEFIGAVEFDPAIAAHHASVWGGAGLHVADVAAVDYRPWAGIDYLHASPSCRHASLANTRSGGECDEDRSAGQAVCRAIREVMPTVFTLENVAGYRSFGAYNSIRQTLKECGYRFDEAVYNAADFSTPQTRKRLFLRAWLLPDALPVPVKTHKKREHLEADAYCGGLFEEPLTPWVGWYEALTHPRYGRDLLLTLPESQFAEWQLKRLPEWFAESVLCEGGAKTLPGGKGLRTPLTRAESKPSFSVVATAEKALPRAFIAHPTADNDRFLIREGDEPLFTVKNGVNPHRASLSGRVVAMTTEALARFQLGIYAQFYKLPTSKKLACQIIGNGVAAEMVRALVLPMLIAAKGWSK